MKKEFKFTIDILNKESVSIKKEQFVNIDGIEYNLGEIHRTAYVNSDFGREKLKKEVPNEIYESVFCIWGDKPLIKEEINVNLN